MTWEEKLDAMAVKGAVDIKSHGGGCRYTAYYTEKLGCISAHQASAGNVRSAIEMLWEQCDVKPKHECCPPNSYWLRHVFEGSADWEAGGTMFVRWTCRECHRDWKLNRTDYQWFPLPPYTGE